MGYGKKGKKSKQALIRERDALRSQRALTVIAIIAGAVVVVASLVLQAIVQGAPDWLGSDMSSGLAMGAFAGIAIGAIVAAVGVIKFIAVNADYKVVVEKLQ